MGADESQEQKKEKNKSLKSELKNETKKESKNKPKDGKDEVITGSAKPIPVNIAYKVTKAVCKITIEKNGGKDYGTGFFLNNSDSKKYLMTCYHVINPSLENNKIILEIHNQKKFQLKFHNRFTKYFDKPEDIAIIEIKESDEIYKEVEYLNYDKNFLDGGYNIYKEQDVFSVEHPGGDDASCASGKITDLYNNNEFEHDISTEGGSSGSPILLLNNNINLIRVIGIHKQGGNSGEIKINYGTFIGEILNKELNNDKINYIISEIYIKEEDVNKDIRIINSYEKKYSAYKRLLGRDSKYINDEVIEKCQIKINDKLIPFKYFYKFKTKGKYIIKYIFKNNINNLCYIFCDCKSIINIDLSNFNSNNVTNMWRMFYECSSLINIDLSNFNTDNVIDMGWMFSGCSSLTNINLSNFNTTNVTNMLCMFYGCSSLTNIDLSNFNINNITTMSGMFEGCSSLTNIDLSNFNTNNVTNMEHMFSGCSSLSKIDLLNFNTNNVTAMNFMFYGCSSLTNIDLSNFNTNNVIYIHSMFSGCSSLTNIDLSNFNTNNVTNMENMFYGCSSLTNIDLSNFNTNNVTNIGGMFQGCKALKKENIITKDKRILNIRF